MAVAVEVEESLASKFSTLLPHLGERQRRLYLGSEARALGHGGIAVVARAAQVSRQTVAAGVDELEAGELPSGRVRRAGGGRKRLTETDPGLCAALLGLVEPDSRGDPTSPLRWTTKSTRKLADELTRQGHRVSADTVAELFNVDRKTITTAVQDVRPLLQQHGYAIAPSTARFPEPTDLIAFLAQMDDTPQSAIKPAC
jgi:Rhodopirellula transposase DDE domain